MANKRKKKESNITTIKIDRATKQRLDKFKEYGRETYTELIKKILNILNICRSNPGLANRILRDIDRSKKRENLVDNPERALRRKNSFKSLDDEENSKRDSNSNNNFQSSQQNQSNQRFPKQNSKPRIELVK